MRQIPGRLLDSFLAGVIVVVFQVWAYWKGDPASFGQDLQSVSEYVSNWLLQSPISMIAVFSTASGILATVACIAVGYVCSLLNNIWLFIAFPITRSHMRKNKEWIDLFLRNYMSGDSRAVRKFVQFDRLMYKIRKRRKARRLSVWRRMKRCICGGGRSLRQALLQRELFQQIDSRLVSYASFECASKQYKDFGRLMARLNLGVSICTAIGLAMIAIAYHSFPDERFQAPWWTLILFLLSLFLGTRIYFMHYTALFSLVFELFRRDNSLSIGMSQRGFPKTDRPREHLP